ncbi:efflux RND transporter periplasmic adaptor subunit [Stieleria sp. JC731]|uniref:efflux RND transporter periplasmic adaptor subunit n=1 Tax=Pirellulaceae TaxID=2691357 RepID=UPI001E283905|nr:efflux RND transporter periplasmic adaptor subunit [Stieleria sp. JC731]MCC9603436.1 efflux RND transporter periplasmic adaptor subunit [Stieleria sp. JC731]
MATKLILPIHKLLLITVAGLLLPSRADVVASEIPVRSVLIRLVDQVDVPARAIGSLVKVNVEEGTQVTAGQVLAQIDDTEVRLERSKAQLEMEIAKLESQDTTEIQTAKKSLGQTTRQYQRLERAKAARNGSVSDSELDLARTDMEKCEYEVQQAESELEKAAVRLKLAESKHALAERNVKIREIVSPQEGVVVEAKHQNGEWVTPGETIFRVISTRRLRVDGFIDASVASSDLRGNRVKLRVLEDLPSGKTFYGKIIFVSPENDPVTEEVRITAEIENPEGDLRPGQRASMAILVN